MCKHQEILIVYFQKKYFYSHAFKITISFPFSKTSNGIIIKIYSPTLILLHHCVLGDFLITGSCSSLLIFQGLLINILNSTWKLCQGMIKIPQNGKIIFLVCISEMTKERSNFVKLSRCEERIKISKKPKKNKSVMKRRSSVSNCASFWSIKKYLSPFSFGFRYVASLFFFFYFLFFFVRHKWHFVQKYSVHLEKGQ